MIRLYVDSGSSIKQEEKQKYNLEILPLKILFDDNEYEDGIDLSFDKFYNYLINEKKFLKHHYLIFLNMKMRSITSLKMEMM